LLALLCIVALVGAWQVSTKWSTWSDGTIVSQVKHALPWQSDTAAAPVQQQDSSKASDDDPWADNDDKSKPPVVKPAPAFQNAAPDEMLPFATNAPLLAKAVPMPARRAPLVYCAYGQDSSDKSTSASIWFGSFLKHQLRSQPTTITLLNLLPDGVLLNNLSRSFEPKPLQATYAQYLENAKAQGADLLVLPVADGESTGIKMRVKMVDMHSSRTAEWVPSPAVEGHLGKAIVEAAIDVMKFAGLDEKLIESSGVREGAPSEETLTKMVATNPKDMRYETMAAALQADPDCRFLYAFDYGTTTRLQLVNQGLMRFPDDVRLRVFKIPCLADNGSSTALVRYLSEMVRRHPDNLYIYHELGARMRVPFEPGSPPRETPQVYSAVLDQMDAFSSVYPDSNSVEWARAYAHKSLGDYVRGGRTVGRIPSEARAVSRSEMRKAYDFMAKVARRNPDNPAVQRAFTYYMTSGGGAGNGELRNHIKTVAALDPRATDVEVEMAHWNSVGYGLGITYIRTIDAAMKSHKGDPEAMRKITQAVGMELSRQIGWEKMTKDEAYTTTNSYLVRFLTGAEFVYSRGRNLGFEDDWRYALIAIMQSRNALLDTWKQTGQNSFIAYQEARLANMSQDWERSRFMADKALPWMSNDDYGHQCRYFLVKALWKLKRYEESLKAAREGIMLFPRKQTFFYMYAIVALEYGQDLETAFDCAWRAIDLGTDNQGCNETFEKLRARLNKPHHPALRGR
jgi:hypothetical protein